MRDLAQWYLDRSKVIFEGQVESQELKSGSVDPRPATSMTPDRAHRLVSFRVLRVYRGSSREIFAVLTGLGAGDCGVDFEVGKRYLVYAHSIDDRTFFTSICTGTALLEDSGPALRLLRKEPPSPDDLLNPEIYWKRTVRRTGIVCGQVIRPDGNPLGDAMVEVWQVRDDAFPPYRDGTSSAADGTFCIEGVSAGKYFLTAEADDFQAGARLMGFYPGVWRQADAAAIAVKAGGTLNGLRFGTRKEAIYTVRFRIVTADGSPVPWESLGVAIDSPARDALAYHEKHGVGEDGSYALGGIPAGHYIVSTYLEPNTATGEASRVVSKWQPANREVNIVGPTEVILKLVPAKE